MNIGKWALSNSKLIYYFIAILVIGGFYSYDKMSKLEDPAITVKQAMVVTTFPGASPKEVELQVSDALEKAIFSMKGVDFVESRSSADLSIISINLLTTIPDKEIEQYWDILRRKVSDVQKKLPEGTTTSVVIDSYGDVFGMFYALTSDGYSNEELADYAELIKQKVRKINGISKIELYGVREPVLNISILEDRMATLGVSPAEVIQTITGQNKTIYSGYYTSGEQRIRVSVDDKYNNVEDIENLIIQGHESDQMRLKDIAVIERGYANPTRNSLKFDKAPAVGISISAQAGTDITKLGDKVEEALAELRESTLPVGIEYNKIFFQPERVESAINTFIINLIESVLIVIVVLMFTMGIRSGIILGSVLIITVIGSLLCLYMFGGTLQRVSLASFILAMGMLVDNAIVIVDGILIDLGKGRLRSKAVTNIGNKTAMPLLGATLIAILAFAPIFLSPDTTGAYVRDLFVVLAVSLLLSWVLSLTMVPLQAKYMLKAPKKSADLSKSKLYKVLNKTLYWGLQHRMISLSIAVLLVAVSALIYPRLPQSFFPDMNYNQLYIEYKLHESNNAVTTEKDLDAITEYLLGREDITHVAASVGGTPSRYNLVRSIATPSLSYGDLIVDFTTEEELVAALPELQKYLTDNYPQAYVRAKRYNLMYSKYPIEAMFVGPDEEVLRDLTAKATAIMERNSNITLVNKDWEPKVPYIQVKYNQMEARNVGLAREDVGLSLLASTEGIPTGTVYNGDDRETIIIKCVDKDGNQIENLENAPVFSILPSLNSLSRETVMGLMTGAISTEDIISDLLATKPLSQSTDGVELKWEDPVIIRYNGELAMRAQCNTIPSVGAEDARVQIKDEIEAIELPKGYSLEWKGEYYAKSHSLKYLFSTLPLAIVLMIAILIMLFKDYKKPVIILLSVPLLLIGAFVGVWISGKAFGFVAICGILGLIGMMIKNGVVLMDEITLQLKEGKEPITAIVDSASSRFRPVMMASLTTILGMIPLLPDAMFGSLAATIMGGLLVGTVITLVFIPIFYSIFFKIKIK